MSERRTGTGMLLTKELLTHMGVSATNANKYLHALNVELPAAQINTPLRVAHFLAQVLFESDRFRAVEENLNYSVERLPQVWPSRFSAANAARYSHNPERLANNVYADRNGNGDEASGDGYRYRGRGLISSPRVMRLPPRDSSGRTRSSANPPILTISPP
jgi:putative chitinase